MLPKTKESHMKSLTLLPLLSLLVLAGCANPEYAQYSKAQTDIAIARHTADAAKYKAMADIAAQGDSSAKVAAVMAMALGGNTNSAQTSIQAPQASAALQWASILVPSLTQVAGMRYNYLSTQTQSNNAAAVAISTNGTFASMGNSIGSAGVAGNTALADMAGKIQAPAANITTTTTLSGTGTLGSGAYSTVDTHAVDNHTVTPAPVVVAPVTPTVPVVVTPSTTVCSVDPVTSALTCH
jgi:hypothetical protein